MLSNLSTLYFSNRVMSINFLFSPFYAEIRRNFYPFYRILYNTGGVVHGYELDLDGNRTDFPYIFPA